MRTFVFIFVSLALVCTCLARVITVDDDGPSDFNDIQAAIDDANEWDTVIVADGVYTGSGNRDIDFLGKAITVRSENGPTNCIIDVNASETDMHRGFIFQNEEDSNSIIRGFTIRNGFAYGGGGIVCFSSHPLISNCIFSDNISLDDDETEYTPESGGALAYINPSCGFDVEPSVVNCTFSNNHAEVVYDIKAGGVYIGNCGMSKVNLSNCIFWENTPNDIDSYCNCKCGCPWIEANFSVLQSQWWYGSNNMVADPCFSDPCGGDYHLQSAAGRWDANSESWVKDANTSVAIDAGDPNSDWRGELWPHGKRINMGAYGGTAEASMSLSIAGDIANLNNDANDIVDYNDLALFVDKWLYDEVLLAEDLDRDGDVDAVDFSIFGQQYSIIRCFPSGHPDYTNWLTVGRPDCWCYPRQCHGDTDGLLEGSKTAYYYVGAADMSTLYDVNYTAEPGCWPATYPDCLNYNPCADLDHDLDVDANDEDIINTWYRVYEPPHGSGVPADCLD